MSSYVSTLIHFMKTNATATFIPLWPLHTCSKHSRPLIIHGKTATFLESGRGDGHLAPLVPNWQSVEVVLTGPAHNQPLHQPTRITNHGPQIMKPGLRKSTTKGRDKVIIFVEETRKPFSWSKKSAMMRMRSSLLWLERLTASAEVATVLGSILASSDTVEPEGRQIKQCWIQYIKNPV